MTDVYLPLYEAKMLSFYDSRFQTYEGADSQNLPALDAAAHDDPNRESLPRYWIAEEHVSGALEGRWDYGWLAGCRRLTRGSDVRTLIPFPAGSSGFADSAWLLSVDSPSNASRLLAILSSFVNDFVVRQKLSGTTLSSYYLSQLSVPSPNDVDTLFESSSGFVVQILDGSSVELGFTSWRLSAMARNLGDAGPPFRWIPERREQIRAEMDAIMFHVYGLDRDEVDYVMETFTVLRKYDVRDHGEFRTKRLILEYYDLLAEAISSSVPYESPISPPPGFGPRHDESTRPYWMKEEQ